MSKARVFFSLAKEFCKAGAIKVVCDRVDALGQQIASGSLNNEFLRVAGYTAVFAAGAMVHPLVGAAAATALFTLDHKFGHAMQEPAAATIGREALIRMSRMGRKD